MQRNWLYCHDDETRGPCSVEQIKQLAANGDILPTDRIWAEGADPATAIEAEQAIDFRKLAGETSPATMATPLALPPVVDLVGTAPVEPPASDVFAPRLLALGPPLPAIEIEASPPPLRPEVAAVHEENLAINERYRRACIALSQWADRDENMPLVMAGETEAICTHPEVLEILSPFQHLPFEVLERLMERLDFMVENRAKYYRALVEQGKQPS